MFQTPQCIISTCWCNRYLQQLLKKIRFWFRICACQALKGLAYSWRPKQKLKGISWACCLCDLKTELLTRYISRKQFKFACFSYFLSSKIVEICFILSRDLSLMLRGAVTLESFYCRVRLGSKPHVTRIFFPLFFLFLKRIRHILMFKIILVTHF